MPRTQPTTPGDTYGKDRNSLTTTLSKNRAHTAEPRDQTVARETNQSQTPHHIGLANIEIASLRLHQCTAPDIPSNPQKDAGLTYLNVTLARQIEVRQERVMRFYSKE